MKGKEERIVQKWVVIPSRLRGPKADARATLAAGIGRTTD